MKKCECWRYFFSKWNKCHTCKNREYNKSKELNKVNKPTESKPKEYSFKNYEQDRIIPLIEKFWKPKLYELLKEFTLKELESATIKDSVIKIIPIQVRKKTS